MIVRVGMRMFMEENVVGGANREELE